MLKSNFIIFLALLCCFARQAEALEGEGEPKEELRKAKFFDLQAGTEFPLSLGVKGVLRIPFGLQAKLGLGFMPSPYVKTINEFLVAIKAYGEAEAEFILSSVKNSFALDIQFGWDPFEPGGFFFDFGYNLLTLGGGVSGEDTLAYLQAVKSGGEGSSEEKPTLNITRKRPSGAAVKEIPVSTTLHNITLHLGWQFFFMENWSLAVTLGVIKTIASSTKIEFARETEATRTTNAEIDAYMDDIYLKYVVSPTIGLHAGYTF